MANQRMQELRAYMDKWQQAIVRQDTVALLYVDAVRNGETGLKEVIADLLRANSEHMDTIQEAITELANDPDFDINDL